MYTIYRVGCGDCQFSHRACCLPSAIVNLNTYTRHGLMPRPSVMIVDLHEISSCLNIARVQTKVHCTLCR